MSENGSRFPDGALWSFFGYAMVFLFGALILFLVVAFVHDLFTGQLPGSNPCEQYQTQEAFELCADSVINE